MTIQCSRYEIWKTKYNVIVLFWRPTLYIIDPLLFYPINLIRVAKPMMTNNWCRNLQCLINTRNENRLLWNNQNNYQKGFNTQWHWILRFSSPVDIYLFPKFCSKELIWSCIFPSNICYYVKWVVYCHATFHSNKYVTWFSTIYCFLFLWKSAFVQLLTQSWV